MATLSRVLLTALWMLLGPAVFAEIGIGDSRETVLKEAGPPTSRAQRGDHEIFLYPRGGRVEFADGKVVGVKGPLPTVAAEPAAAAEATPSDSSGANGASAAPATSAGARPPPAPAAAAKSVPPATEISPGGDASPAAAAEALGKHIEKMDTAWGERPRMPEHEPFNWGRLAVQLVLHLVFTVLALKLAFKIEEMDAFWSGVLAIAGIDLAVYAAMELLGPVSGGITSWSSVQGGVGALVMVGTIQKFCFNKRLQNAVVTAMSVKLVVQLLHIFAFVFLLNALFG